MSTSHLRLSIIIPVFNESGIINHTLNRLAGLHIHGGFEIIVVDGHPYAGTIHGIHPALHRRLRLITIHSPTGRGRQMNSGALRAAADNLLFLHADTALDPAGFERIPAVLGDPAMVAGAFDLAIDSPKTIFRAIEKMASLRSRLTRLPYGDQALFIRRDYFFRIGAFRPIPLMEDVELMQRIKKRGDGIRILPLKARTSPRRWESEGIVYTTLRNWTLMGLYLMGVTPRRLVKCYYPGRPRGRHRRSS